MIDLQLAARFIFVYATVAAATTIGAPNRFTSFSLDHRVSLRNRPQRLPRDMLVFRP